MAYTLARMLEALVSTTAMGMMLSFEGVSPIDSLDAAGGVNDYDAALDDWLSGLHIR